MRTASCWALRALRRRAARRARRRPSRPSCARAAGWRRAPARRRAPRPSRPGRRRSRARPCSFQLSAGLHLRFGRVGRRGAAVLLPSSAISSASAASRPRAASASTVSRSMQPGVRRRRAARRAAAHRPAAAPSRGGRPVHRRPARRRCSRRATAATSSADERERASKQHRAILCDGGRCAPPSISAFSCPCPSASRSASSPRSCLRSWRPALCLALHTPLPWMIGPLLAVSLASIAGAPTAQPHAAAQCRAVGRSASRWGSTSRRRWSRWWPACGGRSCWPSSGRWRWAGPSARWLQRLHADRMPHVPARSMRATTYFAGAIGGASEMTLLAERVGARTDLVAAAHSLRLVLVTIAIPFAMQWSGLHGLEINAGRACARCAGAGWRCWRWPPASAAWSCRSRGAPTPGSWAPLVVAMGFTDGRPAAVGRAGVAVERGAAGDRGEPGRALQPRVPAHGAALAGDGGARDAGDDRAVRRASRGCWPGARGCIRPR